MSKASLVFTSKFLVKLFPYILLLSLEGKGRELWNLCVALSDPPGHYSKAVLQEKSRSFFSWTIVLKVKTEISEDLIIVNLICYILSLFFGQMKFEFLNINTVYDTVMVDRTTVWYP